MRIPVPTSAPAARGAAVEGACGDWRRDAPARIFMGDTASLREAGMQKSTNEQDRHHGNRRAAQRDTRALHPFATFVINDDLLTICLTPRRHATDPSTQLS